MEKVLDQSLAGSCSGYMCVTESGLPLVVKGPAECLNASVIASLTKLAARLDEAQTPAISIDSPSTRTLIRSDGSKVISALYFC